MEIAAGGHIILIDLVLKTMLAKRLPSILPPMTLREALETTKIHSVAGKLKEVGLMNQRPSEVRITRYQMLRLLVGKLSTTG
jgi:magnesium chelatase family protein